MNKQYSFLQKLICSIVIFQMVTLPLTANAVNINDVAGEGNEIQNTGGQQNPDGMGGDTGSAQLNDANNAICPNSELLGGNLLHNVCWTCVFPVIILGQGFGASKDKAPSDRLKKVICICDNDEATIPKVGLTYGLWFPSKIIETVRAPGCFPSLDGITLPFGGQQGTWAFDDPEQKRPIDSSYIHYHVLSFPILVMLQMMDIAECIKDGYMDLDVLLFSEVDPTWYDDEIAFFTNPEAILIASPLGLISCIPDSISSTALKRPINTLWWCAGSWGTMYPFTTHKDSTGNTIQESSLILTKVLAMWHRRYFFKKTYGDEDAACGYEPAFFIPKTQYKITMFFPVPENKSAHVIGDSTLFWGSNRVIPVTGEDFTYIVWTWNDCCLDAINMIN